LKIFRDETSLSASPELWPSIERALSQSRYFVLLASPEAAASHWVDQEIRWWRAHRSHETVLIALTAGELGWHEASSDFDSASPIPPSLRGWFPTEPLWVDMRWARDERDVSLHNPRFRDAVGDLAAPVHGLPKDELIGEDIDQHRRTLRLARGAVALLLLLLAGAVIGALIAVAQRNTAIEQRTLAVARELAAQSTNQRALNPELALLLAIEAVQRQATPETEDALRAALSGDHLRGVLHAARRPLTSVEFGADGRSILTAGDDGRARLWSIPSLAPGTTFHAGPPGTTHAALARQGHRVLTTSERSATKIWNAATGDLVGTLPDRKSGVSSGAISPSGRLIVTAGANGVRLWTSSGQPRGVLERGDSVTSVAFSPDGRTVATGDWLGFVRVWRDSRPTSSRTMRASPDYIESVTFDPSGRAVLAASDDGVVRGWVLAGGQSQTLLEQSSGTLYPPTPLMAELSGSLLAVGSDDGTLTVKDFATTGRDFTTQTDGGRVSDLDFAPDGETIATAQEDGSARLFEESATNRLLAVLRPSPAATNDVAFSPDGGLVAAPDNMGTTRVWSRSGQEVWTVPSRGGIRASFSPDGRLLTVAGSAETAVWPIFAPHPTLRFPGASSDSTFSPDGMLLAIAERNGDVSVRRVSDGRVVEVLAGERGTTPGRQGAPCLGRGSFAPPLGRVEFSPDGSRLLALATDGIVRVWNREEERAVLELGSRDCPITDAAFSPSGGDIATVRGSRVVVTDLESGETDATPELSQDSLETVAYSSDERNILVAGIDGHAFVLDAGELRSYATFVGSGESLTSAAFSPNGTRVALSGDGAVRIFRCDLCAPPAQLLAIAQSNVTRGLSPSERRRYLHESN
jgi:WD40 repeat protein